MVLVQFPFIALKSINGTNRLNQTVYHGLNNKLCRVKLLHYSLVFSTTGYVPMLMRLDSQQLRPSNMPVIDGNITTGIFLAPNSNLAVINSDMSFDCVIAGDYITIDLVEADAPLNDPFPNGSNTFLYGHIAFDITPIV